MPEVKTKPSVKNKTEEVKRVLFGERSFFSDCFKLLVSTAKRNMSWNEVPDYVDVEHCHFFHTHDSNGIAQDKSMPSCGHFHLIEVIPSEDIGNLPKVICKSGPMTFETKKVMGKFKKVMVPADKNGMDNHTHEIEWHHSSEPKTRKVSDEAAKVIAQLTKKPQAPEGVVEG